MDAVKQQEKDNEVYNAPGIAIADLKEESHYNRAVLLSELTKSLILSIHGTWPVNCWEYEAYGYLIGFYLIPKKKRNVASHILSALKEVSKELNAFADDEYLYDLNDYDKEFKQWGLIMRKNEEVDLESLWNSVFKASAASDLEIKRNRLIKYLFDQYEKEVFDEFELKSLCEDIQSTYICQCGREVFSMPTDSGCCQICTHNLLEYSIYLGEDLKPSVKEFCEVHGV